MTRHLRSLKSYLTRRKVNDEAAITSWLAANNINNAEQLQAFCTAALLHCDPKDFEALFPAKVKQKSASGKKSSTSAKAPPLAQADETWHTPAANRPLKRSSAKSAAPKRTPKKTTKGKR